jgi:hypothetical protein
MICRTEGDFLAVPINFIFLLMFLIFVPQEARPVKPLFQEGLNHVTLLRPDNQSQWCIVFSVMLSHTDWAE